MQKHYEEDVSRETSSFYSYLEIVKERKMEIIKIVRRERNLLEILMIIWEDSVRHTHDFLRESDIKALRPLVYQNLDLFLNYGLLRLKIAVIRVSWALTE